MLLGALLLAAGWIVPAPVGLAPAGWHALATLAAIVPALALNALPEGVVALVLAGVWVLGGAVPISTALSGFASESLILMISVLGLGAVVASSGLLYRLAIWTVSHTRGGFTGQVLALAVVGVLVGPTVPAPAAAA